MVTSIMSEKLSSDQILLNSIVKFLAKPDLTGKLIILKKEKKQFISSYISLNDNALEPVRMSTQKFISKRSDWKIRDYGSDLDNEMDKGMLRTIQVGDIPNKDDSILKNPVNIETKIDEKLVKFTKFIGFRFQTSDNKHLTVLSKSSKNNFVLTNSKFHYIRSGIATVFKNNLMKFPDTFALVIFGKTIFIFNNYQFEELFNYHILFEKQRSEIFDFIDKSADYKIRNLDIIKDHSLSTMRFLRKFVAIKEKQIYNKTIDELQQALKIRPIPKLRIDGNEIIFENGTTGFIDFFNDNHLSSHLTGKNYTIQSKTEE